jgi:hypothetical protein
MEFKKVQRLVSIVVGLTLLYFIPAARAQKGTIAYVHDGTEIRLIEADGANDRKLWTHPDLKKALGIDSLAWSPDGKEIAFSSRHAAVASLYDADIYTIRPDGSGLRKLTNAPQMSEFAKFPKGNVSVTFRNDQPVWKQSQASAGVFIVYVAGAAEPQQITLPPGATKTVMFNEVADFGNTAQAVVAIWGNYRWFIPGTDVRAGATVKAPLFSITGDGIEYFGAYRPVWRQDGSRVSFRSGACTLNSVPVNPTPGEIRPQSALQRQASARCLRVGLGSDCGYSESTSLQREQLRRVEHFSHRGRWKASGRETHGLFEH